MLKRLLKVFLYGLSYLLFVPAMAVCLLFAFWAAIFYIIFGANEEKLLDIIAMPINFVLDLPHMFFKED